jgi:eukaryotic-like serine/threonine-protein kinase
MAIKAHAGLEPLPGYKLIDRLGGGGFGEVWKAEAPGGLLKAIKFVHGTLQSVTGEEGAVQQELKSLGRVKSVRHPYILSLERYDIIDGQLLIVMELADMNLFDRLKECQAKGLTGIPRGELLRYMEEASEALDLMNIQYGLQHLDIKPQNLFLVHNHVKVADFGLVKDLEGMNTQVTGGVTPLYAAPETFDGVITRYCDQYNLAIVYQELLTSERPFVGANIRQLMLAHLTGTPDLKSLPEPDRPVIARALSKKPDERFPSCTEMVQALRQAGVGVAELRAESRFSALPSMESPVTPLSPHLEAPAKPVAREVPFPTATEPKPAVVVERKEIVGDGILVPALVIGVGGIGRRVLQHLRRELQERCGSASAVPHIHLLYMETDPEAVREAFARTATAPLADEEILLARLNKPSHYIRPVRGRPSIEAWLNINMLHRVPRNQTTADGLRVLGRLAFVDNYRAIVAKLKDELNACANQGVLQSADKQTRLGIRTSRPRVYVAVNLGGGTGSGVFIDLAYVVRRQMRELGIRDPEIVGVFLLPATDRNARKNPAVVNAFAALTEMQYFSSPKILYTADFDEGEESFHEKEQPFDRSIMVPLPEEIAGFGATEDAIASAAGFVARELVTPLGRVADESRTCISVPKEDLGFRCQTFGTYAFAVPRRVLLDRLRNAVTERLLRSWVTPARTLVKAVRNRLSERLGRIEFSPEGLIAQLQAACEKSLGHSPETAFETIVSEECGTTEFTPQAAVNALGRIEEIIGSPPEDGNKAAATPLSEALQSAVRTVRRDSEHKLKFIVREMIDAPGLRVAGAEEATAQITTMLEEAIEQQLPLLDDLHNEMEQAYRSIEALTAELHKGSWWPGRSTRVAEELRQALQRYPHVWYQSQVLSSLIAIFRELLAKLPKRFEEVVFCRQRLAKWIEAVEDRVAHSPPVRLPPGRYFYPANSNSVEEAIQAMLDGFTADNLTELDEKLQEQIRSLYKSLPTVCLAPEEPFLNFQRTVQQLVQTTLQARLGSGSVTAVYAGQQKDDGMIADVRTAFQHAAPVLPGQRYSGSELRILVVPDDEQGKHLADLAQSADSEVALLLVDQDDEILFYRERPNVPLLDLPQFGLVAEEGYKQMTSSGQFTPHTRTDISDWTPRS